MCQFKHEKGTFFHAKCRKVVVASNAIVLLFALRLLGIKSPIPCNAEQALRLCRRSRRIRRCPTTKKPSICRMAQAFQRFVCNIYPWLTKEAAWAASPKTAKRRWSPCRSSDMTSWSVTEFRKSSGHQESPAPRKYFPMKHISG